MAFVIESLQLKALKAVQNPNLVKINVKKTKIIINNEKAKICRKKEEFPCSARRKGFDSYFILYQFCKCYVYKRCSVIRGRPERHDKFKCRICTNQGTDAADECVSLESY